MKFTEEELRRAAVRVQEKQLAQLPPHEACIDAFSPAYAQSIQQLIEKMKRGQFAQTVAPMGWQYYTRPQHSGHIIVFFVGLCRHAQGGNGWLSENAGYCTNHL